LTNFSHWKLIKNQNFSQLISINMIICTLEQLHSLFTLGLVAWATLMNTNINFDSFNWMWFSFIPKYMLKGLGFSNQQCCFKMSELWTRSLNHCCFSLKIQSPMWNLELIVCLNDIFHLNSRDNHAWFNFHGQYGGYCLLS
jgi:hypothetical protein